MDFLERPNPKLRLGTGRELTNRTFGFRKRVQAIACALEDEQNHELQPVKEDFLKGRRTGILIKPPKNRDEHGFERLSDFWKSEIVAENSRQECSQKSINDSDIVEKEGIMMNGGEIVHQESYNSASDGEGDCDESNSIVRTEKSLYSSRVSIDETFKSKSSLHEGHSSSTYRMSDLSMRVPSLSDSDSSKRYSSISTASNVRRLTASDHSSLINDSVAEEEQEEPAPTSTEKSFSKLVDYSVAEEEQEEPAPTNPEKSFSKLVDYSSAADSPSKNSDEEIEKDKNKDKDSHPKIDDSSRLSSEQQVLSSPDEAEKEEDKDEDNLSSEQQVPSFLDEEVKEEDKNENSHKEAEDSSRLFSEQRILSTPCSEGRKPFANCESPSSNASRKLEFTYLGEPVEKKSRTSSILDQSKAKSPDCTNESDEDCDTSLRINSDAHPSPENPEHANSGSDGDDVPIPKPKPKRVKEVSKGFDRLKAMGRASYCSTDSYAPKASRLSLIAPRPQTDNNAQVGKRQSLRRKIPPLEFWRNERVEYARATGTAVPEIVDLIVRSPEPTPKWVRRRRQNCSSTDDVALRDEEQVLSGKKTMTKRLCEDRANRPGKGKKLKVRDDAIEGNKIETAKSNSNKKLSAFFLFCKDRRSEVVSNHPELDIRSQARLLGEMWKALSEDDKQTYRDKASGEVSRV